jgi:hypothetical protein
LTLDPVYITRTIDALPFTFAPNICVSFPHREDWWNRWPELHGARHGRKHTIDYWQSVYEGEKLDHLVGVMARLSNLMRWATGRAVFAELWRRREYSVHIFPFAFLPPIDGIKLEDALGVTEMIYIPQTRRERAHGIKVPGTQHQKRGWCSPSLNKPGAVDVFCTPERCEENDADGTLLHELVHAARIMSGVFRQTGMRGGYRDSEEFHANTIEMIFRSERGQDVFDYAFHPIDQEKVLKNPMARTLITKLCHQQMSLCNALAQVKADFNPIRPIAEKLFTIDL